MVQRFVCPRPLRGFASYGGVLDFYEYYEWVNLKLEPHDEKIQKVSLSNAHNDDSYLDDFPCSIQSLLDLRIDVLVWHYHDVLKQSVFEVHGYL